MVPAPRLRRRAILGLAFAALGGGCKSDEPLAAPGAECLATREGYPAEGLGCSTGDTIANFRFSLATDAGQVERTLGDYYQQGDLLVWLSATGWCGACRYAARNLDVVAQDHGMHGVFVMASLAENEDGDVADADDAVAWRGGLGISYEVVADNCGQGGTDSFGACGASIAELPTVFVIDLDTMQILYRDTSDRYVDDVVQRALEARGAL